jgi:Na+/melibiose symporter-like transporter
VLTEESYLMALYAYLGAAGILVLYVGWWLSRHWRPAWVTLVVLLLAALLLTPAFPNEGVETMAPALVVFAFQFMTVGVDGAAHALRPLQFMCIVAVVITVLLRLTLFRRRTPRKGQRGARQPARGSGSGARA